MSQLIINNKLINAPIPTILETIRKETGYRYFRDVRPRGNDNYSCTCPFHKDGQEMNPSCQVFCDEDNPKVEYGYFHCFTCSENAHLYQVVAHCFEEDEEFGKEWLVERFGDTFVTYEKVLTDIVLDTPKENFLDESILDEYCYYHPYMWKRKLSKEIVDLFKVGYNPKSQSLTFPIWDDKGRLKLITERSVNTKYFYIQEGIEKPVYLLHYIKQQGITDVWVCESQINTLYCWSLGIPAIGLIGTGTPKQMELLNKSGIRRFVLAFDGDTAGDKAIERFKKKVRSDVIVEVAKIPRGKDINDLTEEEIKNLQII